MGPFANSNNMDNDSDWGFHYNNKNATKNTSNATADGNYAGVASANAKGVADAYAKGMADGFAKGIANAYAKGFADGKVNSTVVPREQYTPAAE
jgi:flagellar biosynthesis/type III secretory pathway protein FliH